jgi:hypothetical protein
MSYGGGSGPSSTGPSPGPSPSPSPGAISPEFDPEFDLPGMDPFDSGLSPDLSIEDAWSTGVLIDTGPEGALPDVWQTGASQIDPFTGQPPPDAPFDPYVGSRIDPFTSELRQDGDNPYLKGGASDPYGGIELVGHTSSGKNQPPAQGYVAAGGAGTAGPGPIVASKDVFDGDGNWFTIYTYADGTRALQPAVQDVGSRVVFADDRMVASPPQTQEQRNQPAQSATPPAQLPPLPPPEKNLSPLPPADPQPVQTTREIVIEGAVPFSPAVSLPAALEHAQGMGHIEGGDVKQFGRGAYNGLAELLPFALGPMLGPLAAHVDIPKASIDPRYAGAAVIGSQIAQNLAFEGVGKLPALGRLGSGVKTEGLLIERVGQDAVISTEPWAQYQVHATGTELEEVFQITENGKTRIFKADGLVDGFMVEAKEGYMGYWRNPFTWEGRMVDQAERYLQVTDAMGYEGVRYAVSDADKVKGLADLFARRFPDAMKSGKLSVWWVPKP